MESAQFIWVVERIDWDQDVDGLQLYWEDRKIMGAFAAVEDARSFAERNAATSHIPYDLKWHGVGKVVYSGHARVEHMEEGVKYMLHYTALY